MHYTTITRSPIFKPVLGFIAVGSFLVLAKVVTYQSYPDFDTYYFGVRTFLHGGNPYFGTQQNGLAFLYPPPALLLLLPLSLLPLALASKAFTIASLGCLIASITLLFRGLKLKAFSLVGIFLIILVANFFPLKFTLGMGQINNVVLLLVSVFLFNYLKGREQLAGVFLGLSLAIKLTPVLLIVYLVVQRRWAVLLGVAAPVVVVSTVTMLLVKPSITSYFLHTSLPALANSWKGDYYNQAFSGWLMRDVASPMLRDVLRLLFAGLLPTVTFFLVWKGGHDRRSTLLGVSAVLTLGLMVNSFSWQHHYVWLLVPLLATFAVIRQDHLSWRYYLVLGLSYILMAINLANPNMVAVPLQSHVLYGALLLYGLDLVLLTR